MKNNFFFNEKTRTSRKKTHFEERKHKMRTYYLILCFLYILTVHKIDFDTWKAIANIGNHKVQQILKIIEIEKQGFPNKIDDALNLRNIWVTITHTRISRKEDYHNFNDRVI